MIETLKIGALEVVVTVALAVLSLASAYAVTWIRAQKAALQARTDAEILDRTIARAAALAESTVLALESTIAKQLREAVKAGLADRQELVMIGHRAVQDVLDHLGDEGRKILDEALGDAQDFVKDLVEAQVERLKQLPFGSSSAGSGVSTPAS